MKRWHFAILSTVLFILAGFFFFIGVGIASLPLVVLAWGIMVTASWEPMKNIKQPLEVPQNTELEPVSVKFSE